MRLFEMLLAASSFILLLSAGFLKKGNRKRAVVVCGASGILLGIHLLLEGCRWQMVFIYIMTALLIPAVIVRQLKKGGGTETRKLLKYGLYPLTTVLFVLSVFFSLYLPVFDLPVPDGPYQVGTETFHFIDGSRDEVLTGDINDKRELMVQIWYPARNSSGMESELLFPLSEDLFAKYAQAYAERFNLPAFVFDYWKYIRTNSYKSAEPLSAAKPLPVILLCHGMGTGRFFHASQAENLASHGFIVAAIDHTYSATATVFPDGRVAGFKTPANIDNIYDIDSRVGKIWEEDVEFVADQLEKLNSGAIGSGFKGRVDLNAIGIMGHSFGGSTAFNALNLCNRIKAGINMDGSLFELEGGYGMDKPFMFMTTGDYEDRNEVFKKSIVSDDDLKFARLTRANYEKLKPLMEKENDIVNKVRQNRGIVLYIEGAAHFNFTDFQLFSKLKFTGMTGDIDGGRGALIVNRYALDFFNKYLRGTGGNLISGPDGNYPEVKFR